MADQFNIMYPDTDYWMIEDNGRRWSLLDGKDGDVHLDIDYCYEGNNNLYIPAEAFAEVLRRMGYEVVRKTGAADVDPGLSG